MVIGNMQQARTRIILITADKVILRGNGHIGSRHRNIPIPRNIRSGRIVHFVIDPRSYRERRHIAFSVIEDRVDIGREHTLVIVVHGYSRIGPP